MAGEGVHALLRSSTDGGGPSDASPGLQVVAASAGPPMTEEEKAAELLRLEQLMARLAEGIALSEKQTARTRGRNAEFEEKLQRCAGAVAAADDSLLLERGDHQQHHKEMLVQLENAKLRVRVLQSEGDRRRRAAEEAQVAYTREAAELKLTLCRGTAEKDRDDTENHLLVRMLNAEKEQRMHDCEELEARLDVQAREDAKNTILLGLLNSQLLAGRAENDRLRRDSDELLLSQRRVEEALSARQRHASLMRRGLDRDARDHTARCDAHGHAIARHAQSHERLEALIAGLERELGVQKDALSAAAAAANARDREHSDAIARRRAELSKLRGQVKDVEVRVRELHEENFEASTRRQTECEKLSISRGGLNQRTDEADMRNFQKIAEQASEIELLKGQVEMAERRRQRFEDESEERLQSLNVQMESVVRQAGVIRTQAEERERESFETVSKVAADNQTVIRRIAELEKAAEERDSAHVAERIRTRAEADRHAREVTQLEVRIEQQSRDHCQRVVDMQREAEAIRAREVAQDKDWARAVRDVQDKTEMVAKEARGQAQHADGLEKQALRSEENYRQQEVAYKAEVRAHKQEVRELQQTASGLEAKVAETHGYRVLAEENKMLEEDRTDLQRQEVALENTIATMQVEKGLLEGYKTKVLKEQNAKCEARVAELERRRGMLLPLLNELVFTANKHRVAEPAVGAVMRCAREIGFPLQHHPAAPPSPARVAGYSGGSGVPRRAIA